MNSIEQDIRASLAKNTFSHHLTKRLNAKLDRIQKSYKTYQYNAIRACVENPRYYFDLLDQPDLLRFFRRDIDIWLAAFGTDDNVYSPNGHRWVRIARKPFRIAIENLDTGKAESWSRIKSLSKTRMDHHKNSKRKKKSQFLGGFDFIRPLEFAAFNEGVGLLEKSDRLKMYLHFDNPIGKSPDGRLQEYICLQCERVPRRRDTRAVDSKKVFGYTVHMHGYPVSVIDLERDFKGTPLKPAHIPTYHI